MSVAVSRSTARARVDDQWDGSFWANVPDHSITHAIKSDPPEELQSRFKITYDDDAIHVIFDVIDPDPVAIHTEPQTHVFLDSCVELFFCPGDDPEGGYFNLEVNVGGTPYFAYQLKPRQNVQLLRTAELDRIEIRSRPAREDSSITPRPVRWNVAARIPLDVLETYRDVQRPKPGVVWRANFYKTGTNVQSPHWITWSPMNLPKPNFHVPDLFGQLIFK